MAGLSRVDRNPAGEGIFSREARTQYVAMAQLHWCMFVNSLRTIHGLFDLGPTGIAWLLYSFFALSFGAALYAAAYSLASHASWRYLPIVYWAVSFFWLMFALFVTSFQEHSDLAILSRFPVSFGSYFFLHSISAATDASTFVGAFSCLGVWLGIVSARPHLYLWATLSLLALALFNILLTRATLVWGDRWLAQRKTREILGAVVMVLLVCLLVTNSLWNSNHHRQANHSHGEAAQFRELQAEYGPMLQATRRVQQWLPPGLAARPLQQTATQEPMAQIGELSLLLLWAALAGEALALRLRAQYRGQNLSWAPQRSTSIERGTGWTLGRSHPLLALVEKELRTFMRTIPWLWAVSMPLLLVLIIAGVFHYNPANNMKSFPYVFPISLAYALAGFTGLFYNLLGAEGSGIQLLFLSPMPVRTIFLAKNLLHSVLYVTVGIVACALVCVRLGVPPFVVLADTGAWLLFMLPCNLAAGIILSLSIPYRINPGRITRPAGAQANSLPAMLIQLAILGVGAAVFWLCWFLKDHWLPVPVFLILAAAAFLVWTRILHHADESANRYRELLITTLMKPE